MFRFNSRISSSVGVMACISIVASPLLSAGFGIFEQGSKAMGMAGAFTAQADDPSAMFHNAGGIAFQNGRDFLVGFTFITNTEAGFTGGAPFPGTGVGADQETLQELPPHFYWVEPVTDKMVFGLGLNAPFGLTTKWEDRDNFPGRFISEEASLTALDLNPTIGWKASDSLGFGFGLVARFSAVELNNRRATINPFTGQPVEIAKAKLEGGVDEGFGFNFGILHRYNDSFSWGFSYRSSLKVDYGGDLSLTQVPTGIPQLDALIRLLVPFDQKIGAKTEIEFPAMASLGFAVVVSPDVLTEVDINWTGWSSFDRVRAEFANPAVAPLEIEENWDDVYNYRIGVRWNRSERSQWRFGYVYDETPQPDAAVGPLLPDADRNGFTVGYGLRGSKVDWDFALMYLPFDERQTSTNDQGFNGTYNTSGLLFGLTIGL